MAAKQNNRKFEVLAREQAQPYLDLVAQGFASLDEAIGQLADRGAALGVAALIAARVKLSAESVMRGLVAEAEEPGIVICRAAGLSADAYSAILRMRCRIFSHVLNGPAEVLAIYRCLPADFARRLLPFLNMGV